MKSEIKSFSFQTGEILADKYEVIDLLGSGWEGEVYLVRERATGIERALKFLFPQRSQKRNPLKWYARKLHKLRSCPMLIQYHTQDRLQYREMLVDFLVSEYVEGVLLKDFIAEKPGGRLSPYEGLHLLYALSSGMETIHHMREYHGDLHLENVIVCKQGLSFELKLLDLYHWSAPKIENIQDDVCNLIRIFYDVTGGAKRYPNQPKFVKQICCGLKRSLILKKFKTAGQLRQYLELIEI